MKVFHDRQKLKQYMTTKPPLQKILKGILHTEDENKQTMKGSIKPHKNKHSESSSESAAYTQILKNQKLNAGITTYLSILTLNVNGLHQKTALGKLD
jgi:hypothetical protein